MQKPENRAVKIARAKQNGKIMETKQIKVTKTVVYDVDSIKWKIQWGKPAGYIVSFDEVVKHLTDYMIEDVKQTNDSRPTRFLEDRGFYELHDDNGKRIPKR